MPDLFLLSPLPPPPAPLPSFWEGIELSENAPGSLVVCFLITDETSLKLVNHEPQPARACWSAKREGRSQAPHQPLFPCGLPQPLESW